VAPDHQLVLFSRAEFTDAVRANATPAVVLVTGADMLA
jgi:hypothetical protein